MRVGTIWRAPGAGVYQNVIPTNLSGIITIVSNTTVTIPSGITINADQIEFGTNVPMGSLVVATNGRLNVRNGTGNDIRLYNDDVNFSLLQVSGTLMLNPSATIVNDNYAGTVDPASHASTFNNYKVLNGGVHIHYSADALPYAEWQTGSTIRFVAKNKSPVISDPSVEFHNFIWDGTNQIGSGQSADLNFSGRLRHVNGSLTFIGTNDRFTYLGSSQNYTLDVLGNFVVQGGSKDF